jgi:hypothetical protein
MLDVQPPIQLELYRKNKDKFCYVNRKWLEQKKSKLNNSAESQKSPGPQKKYSNQDPDLREEQHRVFLTVGVSPRNSYYKPRQLNTATPKFTERASSKQNIKQPPAIEYLKTHISMKQSTEAHLKKFHVTARYNNRSTSYRKEGADASDTVVNTRLNTDAEVIPNNLKTEQSDQRLGLLFNTPVKPRPKLIIKSKPASLQTTRFSASGSKLDYNLPDINLSANLKPKLDSMLTPMQKAIKKIAQSPKLSSNWFYLKDNN